MRLYILTTVHILWTIADSNRSPHPCHGCALPDELMAAVIDCV